MHKTYFSGGGGNPSLTKIRTHFSRRCNIQLREVVKLDDIFKKVYCFIILYSNNEISAEGSISGIQFVYSVGI